MDSPPKEETPNMELPNNDNNLFDVVDDVGTDTIPTKNGRELMEK